MGTPAINLSYDLAAYYEPPDPKVQLTARIRRSTRNMLDGVVRLWKERARLDSDDPEHVDLTFVVERLLRVGAEGAFSEHGGMPETEEQWAALFRVLAKQSKK